MSAKLALIVVPWLAAVMLLAPARLPATEAATNGVAARPIVAVMPWRPAENPPMASEDHHWLRTFSSLLASELREVAAVRVLPADAVLRGLARQPEDEPDNTNTVFRIRQLGEDLGAQWLVGGMMTRTGTTWTVDFRCLDAKLGKQGNSLSASSTNWFELRDQVVRHVLRCLGVAQSPEEQPLLGRVWTTSPQALGWFSQAMADSERDFAEAARLLRKAVGEDPQFVEARGALAANLYNSGRDEEALEAAREALTRKPHRFLAAQMHLLSAFVHLRQGQEKQAQRELAEGLRLWPDHVELLILQAGSHVRDGDLGAAVDCLRKAAQHDPRNPAIYAKLGRLKSKQGDLTNALMNLELAKNLVVDTKLPEQFDIRLALAEAYETLGNLTEALRHYRQLQTDARDLGVPESRFQWVEETVHELERRSEPVPVAATPARQYSPAELEAALRKLLNEEEYALAVNPLASSPEIYRWSGEIVARTEGELARARKLFHQLCSRPKAAGGASRTAQEVFAAWNDPSQSFCCQEYAKLYIALARDVGLSSSYVHVERDYWGRIVAHDCAVVFAEGKAWLVDPAYAWFGVPHQEFRVLDDVQTVAHHAFQPHGRKQKVALCRAGCKLDPDFTWGRMNLALALLKSGELVEARQELDRARKSAPEYWRGYQLEGALALEQGRNQQALEWLRKAADANPDDGDTRVLLGQELFRDGNRSAARDELLAGLRRSPSPENMQTAAELLAVIEEALGTTSPRSRPDAASYCDLGISFLSGPTPDYAEALKWFRKSAEMGHSRAELILGLLYWGGRGVAKDPVTATSWVRKAAERGEPPAMQILALAYERGVGVERNPEEALRWLRRAAEGGDAEAQALLGKLCYEGTAVPKNVVEGLFWLTLAVQAEVKPSELSGVRLGESDTFSAVRGARHLLKKIELFASPEEQAKAKARLAEHRTKLHHDTATHGVGRTSK